MNTILDAELQREVARNRYSTGLERGDVRPAAQALSQELARIITEQDLDTLTPSGLKKLTAAVRAQVGETWGNMWGGIDAELIKLAVDEGDAVTGVYLDYVPDDLVAPADKQIKSAVAAAVLTLKSDVTRSGVWAEFVASNTDSTTQAIVGAIREGYAASLTASQMIRELRGRFNRNTRRFEGGLITGKLVNRAEALVRTGVSHHANVARDQFAETNKKLIQGRILFAALDNRTTTICMGRHLNFYATGERFPSLPFHHNERSQYIFKTKRFDPLNAERTAVGGQPGAKAAEKFEAKQGRTDKKVKYRGRADTSVFNVERIDAKTTADAWLRKQPRWFIDSTLGKERAKLLIDGDLNIDRFTDMTGRELTLAELRETNAGASAFRRANK